MPRLILIVSQSDYLIQVVAINSNTACQTVQIQISWLLQTYTVCKGRVYPGSAGPGPTPKDQSSMYINPLYCIYPIYWDAGIETGAQQSSNLRLAFQ